MKKFKLLALFLIVLSSAIYSCSDNNPVDKQSEAKSSLSLRATLNEIKSSSVNFQKNENGSGLCFDFVFPITLEYNNGTQISVTSFDGLLNIINQENSNFYLDGIVFPFQIDKNGEILTVNNENEFHALIDDCGLSTIDDSLYMFDCYEIVYPFSVVMQNNETVVITSQQAYFDLISSPNSNSANYVVDFVFPISLSGDGENIVINNIFELSYQLSLCDYTDCICPAVYAPVCVQDENFIYISYDNECLAICAGYTSADFIDCGDNSSGDFSNGLDTCFSINYPVIIENQNNLVTVNSSSELIQNWSPNQTVIPNFNYPIDVIFLSQGITVSINGQSEFLQLISENCN